MATLYADFTLGDEGNAGTQLLPLKYAVGMGSSTSGKTLSAGDSMLQKRGCTWREQLTVPSSGSAGNPITFGAYGTGAKPIFNEADVVTGWTQYIAPGESEIFSDGFESGDLTAWTASSGLSVDAESKRSGTYGAHADGVENAYAYKTLASTTLVGSLRSYIYLNAESLANTNKTEILRISTAGGTALARVWLYQHSDGNVYIDITAMTGTAPTNTFQVSTGQWYKVEAQVNVDASSGWVKLYVDDDLKVTRSDLNTGTTAAGRAYCDMGGWADEAIDIYYDDFSFYDISDEGGPIDVWYATVTTEPAIVVFDGTHLGTHQTSVAALAAEYDWYWEANVLYVYAATDPDARYTSVEAGARERGIVSTNKDYITIQDIDIRNCNHQGILNNGGGNWIVDGVTVSYTDDEGIKGWGTDGTDNVDGFTVTDSTVAYAGYTGIYVGNYGVNGTIARNTVHHCCWNTANNWNGGIKIWSGPFGTEDPTNVSGFTIEENHLYSNGVASGYRGMGIWLDFSNSNILRRNRIHDNVFGGIHVEKSSSCQVYYNIIYNHTQDFDASVGRGIYLSMDDGSMQVDSNTIYNNVIYNSREGLVFYGAGSTQSISDNLVKNNIILTAADYHIFYYPQGRDSGNVFANNCLGAEPIAVSWNGAAKTTYDTWETAYGGTTASVEADPLMVDPANGDFRLQAGSPARDAGVDVSLTQDYRGKYLQPDVGISIGAFDSPTPGANAPSGVTTPSVQ